MYVVQQTKVESKSESTEVLTPGSVKVAGERFHMGSFTQKVVKVSVAVYVTLHLLLH